MEQLHGAQFHIVHPIVFFIDIRRHHRSSLSDTRFLHTFLISGICLRTNQGCKFGIEILQDTSAQSKARSKLTGCTCYTRSSIHELASYLRFSATEIHRATFSWTIAIVHHTFRWQSHTGMVTVIGNLIIKFTRFRIHAVQPIQTPFDFIDDIRNSVGFLMSIRIVCIPKSLRILLISKKHLIDGISRSSSILQIVCSIVPTSTNIQRLTGFGWMINNVSIMHMATILQHRVVSTTLLTHIVQQKISSTIIYSGIDREARRNSLTRLQVINPSSGIVTKVQAISTLHVSNATCSLLAMESLHHLLRIGIH